MENDVVNEFSADDYNRYPENFQQVVICFNDRGLWRLTLMDFAQEGELQLEKHRSLNKIGHALHYK